MKKRNPEKSPPWPHTNDRGAHPDFSGRVLSLLVWVAFFHPSTAEAWRGLAMGNQICSQIPLRIIVARGNSYSGISNRRCIYISDYLLGRISTDPPRWACEKVWKSVMSLANRAYGDHKQLRYVSFTMFFVHQCKHSCNSDQLSLQTCIQVPTSTSLAQAQ